MDSLEIPPSGDPPLLSESPQFSLSSVGSSSRTGPGGEDLSLSELYPDNSLPQRPAQARRNDPPKTRPSIAQALGFGPPIVHSQDASTSGVPEEEGEGRRGEEEQEGDDGNDDSAAADVTVRAGEDVDPTHLATQSREEKLQNDLFVLRQLNGAFAAYNDALRETQAGTEASRCPGRQVSVGN